MPSVTYIEFNGTAHTVEVPLNSMYVTLGILPPARHRTSRRLRLASEARRLKPLSGERAHLPEVRGDNAGRTKFDLTARVRGRLDRNERSKRSDWTRYCECGSFL